jgi:hypothetical protein
MSADNPKFREFYVNTYMNLCILPETLDAAKRLGHVREEYIHVIEYSDIQAEREAAAKLVDCLTSISKNSCCDQCQEAKKWADNALAEYRKERGEP